MIDVVLVKKRGEQFLPMFLFKRMLIMSPRAFTVKEEIKRVERILFFEQREQWLKGPMRLPKAMKEEERVWSTACL